MWALLGVGSRGRDAPPDPRTGETRVARAFTANGTRTFKMCVSLAERAALRPHRRHAWRQAGSLLALGDHDEMRGLGLEFQRLDKGCSDGTTEQYTEPHRPASGTSPLTRTGTLQLRAVRPESNGWGMEPLDHPRSK